MSVLVPSNRFRELPYLKELQADTRLSPDRRCRGTAPFREHFKLVATPALIKIYPEPCQTLLVGNLIAQLKIGMPRWQHCRKPLEIHDSLPESTDKGYRVSKPKLPFVLLPILQK